MKLSQAKSFLRKSGVYAELLADSAVSHTQFVYAYSHELYAYDRPDFVEKHTYNDLMMHGLSPQTKIERLVTYHHWKDLSKVIDGQYFLSNMWKIDCEEEAQG